MQLVTIAAMLFSIAGVMFALQNNVPVTLTFLLWRFDSSLALVVLMALAMGGVIVALVSTPSTLRKQWELGRQKKRIAELERIGEEQGSRIQALERQLPQAEAAALGEPAPYVGLKQMMVGKETKDTPPDPAQSA